MEADEEGTLAALKAIRRELTDPKIAEYRGRIVKTTGDGALVEFASVVEAVRCAVEVQTAIAERNADIPADRRIEFRIGINLGDIILDEGDIYGEGVNVAARLEALAEPGGICASRVVCDQVGDRLAVGFEDMGEQQVKNIARPVHVFRIGATGSRSAVLRQAEEKTVGIQPAGLPLPDKPSLAVLPFQNMSSDPEQEFFADGIAEDVITALSRYPSLFVIARNSSFTYKGRAVDVKQVGSDLGVRYVLEGSLRKAVERIRVTAQLIEADTGNHLWAERYDRALADIFALQDEITEAVTIAVAPTIDAAERRRALRKPPDNLDAWASYQQGLWHLGKATVESNEEARRLFERAIELDPNFAAPQVGLARAFGYAAIHYRVMPTTDALRLSSQSARKATDLDPTDADALASLAAALAWQGDMTNALATARLALSLNANCAAGQLWVGACLIMTGNGAEGRPAVERAKRLSPVDNELADNAFSVACSILLFRPRIRKEPRNLRAANEHPPR